MAGFCYTCLPAIFPGVNPAQNDMDHGENGITNDPNDWAKEVGNPRYIILDLLLSIIHKARVTLQ